eukprot:627524-Pyramimonas_sp.AAC.1
MRSKPTKWFRFTHGTPVHTAGAIIEGHMLLPPRGHALRSQATPRRSLQLRGPDSRPALGLFDGKISFCGWNLVDGGDCLR